MRTNRFLIVGFAILLFVISSASSSQAGTRMYEGSWIAESFGNDRVNIGTKESQYFEVAGIPIGANCHPDAPRCALTSTPVTTTGSPTNPGLNGTLWHPLGPGCRPLTAGEKPRPAKNGTLTTGDQQVYGIQSLCPPPLTPIRPHERSGFTTTVGVQAVPCNKTPPLYRNANFFTAGGAASNQTCQGDQTVSWTPTVFCTDTAAKGNCRTKAYLPPGDPKRGIIMKGAPLTGSGSATTTASNSFKLPAAAASPAGQGMRITTSGSFIGEGPYLYSYTYATLRNDKGSFGPGQGLGNINITYELGKGNTVASINVKQGAARFGGTMQMLGALTAKACYYWQQGCSLGQGVDWRYEAVGASGVMTNSGIITAGYVVNSVALYYHTALMQTSTVSISGSRFPWTTGSVTVKATGRGPHKTAHYAHGYDNRTPTTGKGTIQLVTPLLTRWNQTGANNETGGIGILRIKLVPEPQTWAMLVAGVSLLGVGYRMRGR